MENRYIHSLNALRGVAALCVFFFHAPTLLGQHGLQLQGMVAEIFVAVFSKGYLAVDLFFILSGFVLMHVYGDKFSKSFGEPRLGQALTRQGYWSFIQNRLARIYPMHLLSLLVLLVWHLLLIISGSKFIGLFQLPFLPEKSVFSLATNLLLIQSWHLHPSTTWNSPAWSISAEWFAYLLAPFLIAGLGRFFSAEKSWSFMRALGLYVVFAIALVCVYSLRQTLDVTYDFGVPRMLLEFLMGLCLYRIYRAIPPQRHQFMIAAVFWIALFFECVGGLLKLPDVALIVVHSLLILSSALSCHRLEQVLSAKPLFYFGEISYSFYLLHGIAMQLVLMALLMAFPHISQLYCWLSLLLSLAFCVTLSHLAYRYVECPAREWLKKAFQTKWRLRLFYRLPVDPKPLEQLQPVPQQVF
ncbi:MAG: acyltransferase [Vampirovibrionales bacterium]|nr:acyltransferase [Vampirovibrionales bacterium]